MQRAIHHYMSTSARVILSCVLLVACKSTKKSELAPSGPGSDPVAAHRTTHSDPSDSDVNPDPAKQSVTPSKSYDLPSTEEELRALLASATPERLVAVKGQLRKLAGKAELSFSRTAVVGASLSAGFGGLPLSSAIDKAIEGQHQMIALADILFFKAPQRNGRAHIAKAIAEGASVIFAVDLLFWYVYTSGDLEHRLSRLELALRELEQVDLPLILGDIPDMRTGQPWMLPPEVIPPPEHLRALNERVRRWAQSRLNVHLVPLAEWSAALATDGTIEVVAGEEPVPAKSLIHIDGLHPNAKGVRYMLLRIDASLEIGFPEMPTAALRF